MKRVLLVTVLAFVGCRTEIMPVVKKEPTKATRMVDAECRVHDYRYATDVPANANNLGWVIVKRLENDDATFEKLREEVCKKGGNAFSQAHWNRVAGASIADPPVELEANAWDVPQP